MNYVDGLTAVSCPPSFVARKDNEVLIYGCGFYVKFFFFYCVVYKMNVTKKGISISNGINWTKGNLNCMGFLCYNGGGFFVSLLNWLGLNWNDCVYRFYILRSDLLQVSFTNQLFIEFVVLHSNVKVRWVLEL